MSMKNELEKKSVPPFPRTTEELEKVWREISERISILDEKIKEAHIATRTSNKTARIALEFCQYAKAYLDEIKNTRV